MTPEQFKELRLKLGLSQAQLALCLDIPKNTIARWERGDMAMEHPVLLRLAIEHLACKKPRQARKNSQK